MSRELRVYSDEEVATALATLASNGGNVKKTAKQLNIPRMTLATWAKTGTQTRPQVVTLVTEKKAELSDEIELATVSLAKAIPAKIPDASLIHTATSLGILADKLQNLRGGTPAGPTVNIFNQITAMSRDELSHALEALRSHRVNLIAGRSVAGSTGNSPAPANEPNGTPATEVPH